MSPRAAFVATTLVAGAGLALAAHTSRRLVAARRELAAARHAASHDPLTRLLNRDGLTQAWPMLAPACPAVVLVDLDRFKPINDRHGHAAGDAVLVAVAARIREHVTGVAARLGGDEFAAVLAGPHAVDAVAELAEAIAAPVTLPAGGGTVTVTASVGLTRAEDGDLTAALARADAAMYRAKTTGDRVAVYDQHQDDRPAAVGVPRPGVRVRELPREILAYSNGALWI